MHLLRLIIVLLISISLFGCNDDKNKLATNEPKSHFTNISIPSAELEIDYGNKDTQAIFTDKDSRSARPVLSVSVGNNFTCSTSPCVNLPETSSPINDTDPAIFGGGIILLQDGSCKCSLARQILILKDKTVKYMIILSRFTGRGMDVFQIEIDGNTEPILKIEFSEGHLTALYGKSANNLKILKKIKLDDSMKYGVGLFGYHNTTTLSTISFSKTEIVSKIQK